MKLYKDPRDFRPPPTNNEENQENTDIENDRGNDDNQNNQENEIRQQNRNNDNQNKKGGWHEVEKLLKSKYVNNRRHYFVKWADGSKPTWEPSNHVSQLLKQLYHSTVKRRKRKMY